MHTEYYRLVCWLLFTIYRFQVAAAIVGRSWATAAMSNFPPHTSARAGVIAVIYLVYTREDATVQEEESPAQSARRLAVCTTDILRDETAAARKKMREKNLNKIILLL